ncbi:MAG: hypothetical protein E7596_07520 [Ruminococcaceae bacterium]|nr:hypothetical protein [Oscillospiraceae bacterium]
MKRLFFILILFGVLCLCACGKEYGILDYQSKNIVAECIVNGNYRVVLTKENDFFTVTVKEPREATGISFEIEGDTVSAVSGDTKIQLEKSALGGICAISQIFSQSEDCLTSATEKGGGSVLTFQKESCMYQITIGESSVPKRVKIISEAFEYDIEICSIELT